MIIKITDCSTMPHTTVWSEDDCFVQTPDIRDNDIIFQFEFTGGSIHQITPHHNWKILSDTGKFIDGDGASKYVYKNKEGQLCNEKGDVVDAAESTEP